MVQRTWRFGSATIGGHQTISLPQPAGRSIPPRTRIGWTGWTEVPVRVNLLSATRRGEPAAPSDHALDRDFNTGELVAEHASGGQGVPVRFLSPAAVRGVAEAVGPISHDSLIAHYHPARMEAAAVSKFLADRADEAEWMRIVQAFDEFQTFFLVAADAVIVVRD